MLPEPMRIGYNKYQSGTTIDGNRVSNIWGGAKAEVKPWLHATDKLRNRSFRRSIREQDFRVHVTTQISINIRIVLSCLTIGCWSLNLEGPELLNLGAL